MIVTVKLFARARELAERGEVRVDVPDGATVAQLRRQLREDVPALTGMLDRCAVAVDEEFANEDTILRETSEVALIPPVSGG
jgi:molybdopterin converting factor subunit 1